MPRAATRGTTRVTCFLSDDYIRRERRRASPYVRVRWDIPGTDCGESSTLLRPVGARQENPGVRPDATIRCAIHTTTR